MISRTRRALVCALALAVGAKQREADIETAIDAAYDVRVMHDVILVKQRKGLRITDSLLRIAGRGSDTAGFDHRIDLIFTKPRLRAIRGQVVGDELRDRAANGLRPSGHAGVAMTLRLSRR